MFVGYFSERPYQDFSAVNTGPNGGPIWDLGLSNGVYDPALGRSLYNRYFDEKVFAEQMGFDGLMLNEHHSSPFCMGNRMDIEAAILARITNRAKILLLGNVLPIWDNPLMLAEELAMIDVISGGRLITGWVRGTGRESVAHNAQPPFNWERFQEAHDLIVKAWSTPGPFRWEGEHFQYRYVNPFPRPMQQPHPPIWIPGALSRNTVKWAAEHRYPYVMLATEMEPTKASFAYYNEVAEDNGYESGTQHIAYMLKVHVDETEELAEEAGRRYLGGPSNIFLEGNQGTVDIEPHEFDPNAVPPWSRPAFAAVTQNLPGMSARGNLLPTANTWRKPKDAVGFGSVGIRGRKDGEYERLIGKLGIIAGTPKTVIPKIRQVLEYLRPGSIILWDGEGAMTHDDAMRSLRLMGSDVIPAIREMSKELDLKGPFEIDPLTNETLDMLAPELAIGSVG